MSPDQAPDRAVLSRRFLLSVFLALPAFAGVIIADKLIFSSAVAQSLPRTYPSFLLYVFFAPHVYASTLTFIDPGHHQTYGWRLWGVLGVIVVATHAAYVWLDGTALFAVYALLTVTHFVNQQAGISKMMMRSNPEGWLLAWRGCLIAGTTIAYLTAFSSEGFADQAEINLALFVIAILATGAFLGVVRSTKRRDGQLYALGSHAMFVGGWLFLWAGYPLLAFVASRIIHDTTAFSFYVVHDTNRNAGGTRNLAYRALGGGRVVRRWGTLLVAFPLGVLFYLGEGWMFLPVTSVALSYFHYYCEAFMWKSGAPHREAILLA